MAVGGSTSQRTQNLRAVTVTSLIVLSVLLGCWSYQGALAERRKSAIDYLQHALKTHTSRAEVEGELASLHMDSYPAEWVDRKGRIHVDSDPQSPWSGGCMRVYLEPIPLFGYRQYVSVYFDSQRRVGKLSFGKQPHGYI